MFAKRLKTGTTLGIFTPSYPAHVLLKEKFEHGINELKRSGFKVVEGCLTKKRSLSTHLSGSAKERAEEFMDLINNPYVDGLIATIGGSNSASILPYLDYHKITQARKPVIGYSNVNAIQLAMLTKCNLSSFYGPAVVPTFGEWPEVLPETLESFKQALMGDVYAINPFNLWSNHFRDARTDEWRIGKRLFKKNSGWRIVRSGYAAGRMIVTNLSTLCTLIGTEYFPDLDHAILLCEDVHLSPENLEKCLNHLVLAKKIDKIRGLVVSKSEIGDANPEDIDLVLRAFSSYFLGPILSFADFGHTHPMHTLEISRMASIMVNTNVKFAVL